MKIQSINPFNQELLKEYETLGENELMQLINQAQNAFLGWKNTSFEERSAKFLKLFDLMMNDVENLAKLDTLEMGMLYSDALGDVKKSASNVEYFAKNSSKFLQDIEINENGVKAKIKHEPLGIIYSILPWNYPYNQALRSVVPNIMAGNVVLLKHAANVPQVALKLQELFDKAGFPKGVYTNLFISHDMSEKIISNPIIKGVNITGSDKAGREIGSLAGKYLKPSIVELGGNDSLIIGNINNIDNVVKNAIKGRFSNAGQKCNSSKRIIVIEKYYQEFLEKFTKEVEKLKIGDPFLEETKIGPLAKISGLEDLHTQVQDSIKKGAKLIFGGEIIKNGGNFYKPTILIDVKPGMKVFDEETFGPVVPIIKVKDIDEAIEVANNSVFGLGCSVFSDNQEELEKVINKVEVGNIAINSIVTSYSNIPYGGIKNTGYGKELGEEGLKAFVNKKVILY